MPLLADQGLRGEKMTKSIEDLEKTACKYWPQDIAEAVAKTNPIPLLVQTQDKFLSILKCADANAMAWADVLCANSTLSANLFLKHLCVLADIGGERLQRFSKDFSGLFPTGSIEFYWNGSTHVYTFSTTTPGWTNQKLGIDKDSLLEKKCLSNEMKDVIMLLLFGGTATNNDNLPDELIQKCTIGTLIGRPLELENFVRQRYIYVSKITGGSTANDCGHACEESCVSRLRNLLPDSYVIGGHSIPGITQNDKNETTFDIVVSNPKTQRSCAIEISFQVTTNSVIERKSLLAKERQMLLHESNHRVAYIIDGSGNFQRRNAVSTILMFSDCSVNFSDAGMKELADFIVENC
jgi:hypothetical protein